MSYSDFETEVFQGTFFAVSIQEHKILGAIFTAHILKLLSKDGGIYTVADNVLLSNIDKWEQYLPKNGKEIIKLIDETSDNNLIKVTGKGKITAAKFFNQIKTDKTFSDYVYSYLQRRIFKTYQLLVVDNVPVFRKEKNFSNLYHDHLLRLYPYSGKITFKFTVTPDETKYSLSASHNGQTITLKNKNAQIICNNPCIILLKNKLLRFENIDANKLKPFFTKDFISIPKATEKKYFESFVLNTVRNQHVVAEGFNIIEEEPTAEALLSLETKLNGELGLILYFKYNNRQYLSHNAPQNEVRLLIENDSYTFYRFSRDAEWEEKVKDDIKSLNLINTQGSEYMPKSTESEYNLIEWINQNEELVSKKGILIEQNVHGVKFYLKKLAIDLNAKLQNDWFDVYGIIKFDDYEIPFILLKKNIIKGIREYVLPDGKVFIIPEEWFAKYKPLFIVGKVEKEKLALSRSSFGFIQQAEVDCSDAANLLKRFEKVNVANEVAIPNGLKAQLRDYQKLGLLWMQILNDCSIGGCLADDMGLGKTVQTLSVLLHNLEKNSNGEQNIPTNGIAQMGHTSLLVVPTSLLFNWQREIRRFAPGLSVYQFTGPNRTRVITKLVNHNIVLTTYGVLRNDIDMLKDVRFNYVVLDESQTIKNPTSKVYRSALLLKAKHYLTLSGTPIENSLIDLWAHLNFLNRGMLGSLRSFREEFVIPIEKGNEQVQKQLKRIVNPFILRRDKKEVAPELPELNEQVVFCNLSEEQKAIYDSEKSIIRNQIIENIDGLGYSQSAISILRGLTRLRQIANHPKMLDDYPACDSGKFEEITRTIETLIQENHKVLVFSSFVKHLKIVEKFLNRNEIDYQMLTGSTTNRQQKVDDFQNNPSSQVFLISIKAGGVGLNLTAADYIMVLDPWWNPAVENQAIARAHRIGQDKKVFVYRFISVGTVEEKIQRLQESKLLLSENFVNNANPLSAIGKEQIMEILS
ncbi:MAG: DEAD/DEAH box helicase [Bacteroidales bacterium]